MKILSCLTLAAALLASAFTAEAGGSRGRSSYGSLGASPRSNYAYRNPYAAYPSVNVHGYYQSSGTYVYPHYRTPANYTITDNLSYRGYGTIRVPRY